MMSNSSSIHFEGTKCIITYDLSPCNISSAQICKASDGQLHCRINIEGKYFDLPNTTLETSLHKDAAIKAFKDAVKSASAREKITHLFVAEVDQKYGYIEVN